MTGQETLSDRNLGFVTQYVVRTNGVDEAEGSDYRARGGAVPYEESSVKENDVFSWKVEEK